MFSEYNIAFKGLSEGLHTFHYEIGPRFFEQMEDSLIDSGILKADLQMDRQLNMLTLNFTIKGTVQTPCDRCLETLDLPVKCQGKLIVKFGEAYDEPSDEIIVVPYDTYQLNVAQYIYEFIGVNLPIQRIHPHNSCNPEMLQKLEAYTSAPEDEDASADPRWDELKKLLDKNK